MAVSTHFVRPGDELFPEQLQMDLVEIRRQQERDQLEAHQAHRVVRSRRRRIAAAVSRAQSIRGCGKSLVQGRLHGIVKGEFHAHGPRAGAEGVWRCGKLHLCDDCAGKGREKRAARVAAAAAAWLGLGGFLAFCTFTLARVPGEPLEESTKALQRTMARFMRPVRDSGWHEQAQVIGNIESWEWTVDRSLDGSGHAHLMRLFFYSNPAMQGEWNYWLGALWVKAAKAEGRRASTERGMWVEYPELADDGTAEVLGAYFAKGGAPWGAGRELARSDRKAARDELGGFAPFEVLDVIGETGEGVEAWRAYEDASQGKAVCRFSRGLEAKITAAVELGERITPADDDEEDDVDQAAQEEEQVLDKLEGKAYVAFDGCALNWMHRVDFMPTMLSIVEEAMLVERDSGVCPDVVEWVRSAARRMGAPFDAVEGFVTPEEAERQAEALKGLDL